MDDEGRNPTRPNSLGFMDHLCAIVASATLLHARGQYEIEKELKFKKIEPIFKKKYRAFVSQKNSVWC
jgi:hypothetical protein